MQTSSSDFPGTVPGYDDAWDFEKFKKVCEVAVLKLHIYLLLLLCSGQ